MSYNSVKFITYELKYQIYDKIFFILYRIIKIFKCYMLSRTFKVIIDNKVLYEFIKNLKPEYDTNSRRIIRLLKLKAYNFTIHFKPGHENLLTYYLSQNHDNLISLTLSK